MFTAFCDSLLKTCCCCHAFATSIPKNCDQINCPLNSQIVLKNYRYIYRPNYWCFSSGLLSICHTDYTCNHVSSGIIGACKVHKWHIGLNIPDCRLMHSRYLGICGGRTNPTSSDFKLKSNGVWVEIWRLTNLLSRLHTNPLSGFVGLTWVRLRKYLPSIMWLLALIVFRMVCHFLQKTERDERSYPIQS